LTYLHSKKVIHRAIHPSNILFCSSDKDDFVIKVTGYESASSFTSKAKTNVENDEEYTPPEILAK
jgi:serine/threonine protein kinase